MGTFLEKICPHVKEIFGLMCQPFFVNFYAIAPLYSQYHTLAGIVPRETIHRWERLLSTYLKVFCSIPFLLLTMKGNRQGTGSYGIYETYEINTKKIASLNLFGRQQNMEQFKIPTANGKPDLSWVCKRLVEILYWTFYPLLPCHATDGYLKAYWHNPFI